MKRFTLILSLSLFWISAFAQLSKEDVFEKDTETLWLGLDFTNFKIRGEDVEASELKKHLIGWNSLILKEEEKYNIAKFFDKKKVERAIDPALKRNEETDPKNLIAESVTGTNELEKGTIESIAKDYADQEREGALGILFVMEEFNKVKEFGSMWVSFIDMGTGDLLHAKRFETEPGGWGFRNYWAKTYFNAMQKAKEKGLEAKD